MNSQQKHLKSARSLYSHFKFLVVRTSINSHLIWAFFFLFTQGVMKVRKRVTLMIVIVTAIFGICWGTNQVIYLLRNVASVNIDLATIATVNTMVMFNSAVNPFVYALMNQQFREKIKGMILCSGFMTSRVRHSERADDIGRTNETAT